MIRQIDVNTLIPKLKELIIESNIFLDKKLLALFHKCKTEESNQTAKDIFEIMIENHKLAIEERLPLCQDTGVAVFFLEIGQDIHFINGNLYDAINQAVKLGYKEGYLRKSIVDDPFLNRVNTGDNTPAVIHSEIVPGDKFRVTFAPKGGGAENMSRLKMLKPGEGKEGIAKFVIDTVVSAGGNPCPPIIVGIGIGGNFEKSAILAKKALLRDLDESNPISEIAHFEKELLERINKLDIGPQGLGGKTTALKVNILTAPCHIASLPVAINIQCHSHRHKTIIF